MFSVIFHFRRYIDIFHFLSFSAPSSIFSSSLLSLFFHFIFSSFICAFSLSSFSAFIFFASGFFFDFRAVSFSSYVSSSPSPSVYVLLLSFFERNRTPCQERCQPREISTRRLFCRCLSPYASATADAIFLFTQKMLIALFSSCFYLFMLSFLSFFFFEFQSYCQHDICFL